MSPQRLPLAFGLAIAAASRLAFFGVVEDYIEGDPLIQADLRVVSYLRTLREPGFSRVMLLLTYLGNWQVPAGKAAADRSNQGIIRVGP
jgi:hypothetical protein